MKSITVKQGQTITLEAPYAAEPLPTMTWERESTVHLTANNRSPYCLFLFKVLTPDDRTEMTQTNKLGKLVITKSVRADTGRYSIRLINDTGTDTAECEVIVLGPPSKPRGPLAIKNVNKSSVTLSWTPPADNGGREIT